MEVRSRYFRPTNPRSCRPNIVRSRYFATSSLGRVASERPARTVRPRRGPQQKRVRLRICGKLTLRSEDPARRRIPEGWSPPCSPWRLIEEWLWHQPWQMLVACILLNRTTAVQVLNHQVLSRIIARWPHPSALASADVEDLIDILRPLGLHRNRARSLQRFSHECIHKQWDYPISLHGIGKYANDAYKIFCLGRWRTTQPSDKELRKYVCWLRNTDTTTTATP